MTRPYQSYNHQQQQHNPRYNQGVWYSSTSQRPNRWSPPEHPQTYGSYNPNFEHYYIQNERRGWYDGPRMQRPRRNSPATYRPRFASFQHSNRGGQSYMPKQHQQRMPQADTFKQEEPTQPAECGTKENIAPAKTAPDHKSVSKKAVNFKKEIEIYDGVKSVKMNESVWKFMSQAQKLMFYSRRFVCNPKPIQKHFSSLLLAIRDGKLKYMSDVWHIFTDRIAPSLRPVLNAQCSNPMDCGGNVYRQTFFMPDPPPEHIMCRKRLPTPPPNVHEQTIVVRPPRQIIHEVIEQPVCPPPIVRKNFVMGNAEPPQYLSSTVCVQPQQFFGGGQFGGMGGGGQFGGIGGQFPSPYGGPGINTMPMSGFGDPGYSVQGFPSIGGGMPTVPGNYGPPFI